MSPNVITSSQPWEGAAQLLHRDAGVWRHVSAVDLARRHAPVSLMFLLARIANIRPPFGHSLFDGVLCRTPGTRLDGDAMVPYEHSLYLVGTSPLEEAERVLADALRRNGAGHGALPVLPVDDLIVRYVNELVGGESVSEALPSAGAPVRVDMCGMRDLVGAVEAEQEQRRSPGGFIDRFLRRGHQRTHREHEPESQNTTSGIEIAPQWLTADAIKMIETARIVSLASWQEAMKGLSPRACQLVWTAADGPALPVDTAYRPAHDPRVVAAFAAVPYAERAVAMRPGVHSHDAAICRRYGRDPVDDNAAARLEAVHEASDNWGSWQEELADGALAARGLIDTKGLTQIGDDPFLKQQYARDVKNTVETERWVTSWLDAGGSLKE